MKEFARIGLLSTVLLLSGCASVSPNNDQAKALALAAENGQAFLMLAQLPLQYYCEHSIWPSSLTPASEFKPLLMGVRHLRYLNEGVDYSAEFQLHSFIPGDEFVVTWRMTIIPPIDTKPGPQLVPIALTASKYKIIIPFEYEYDCHPGTA